MINYNEMTDLEINRHVAVLRKEIIQTPVLKDQDYLRVINSDGFIVTYDPCNNPSDAWPIIVKNEISVEKFKRSDLWCSSSHGIGHVNDRNPLRAAMIVFLMMNEVEL